MSTLNEIQQATKLYSDARAKLSGLVTELTREIEALKRARLAEIKAAVAHARERESALNAMVQQSPSLFIRPRTVVFHGVKIGFAKGIGVLEWDNPDNVIKLIRKKLPELADTLINIRETPVKKAIECLTADQIKSIGCRITNSGDRVIIKSTDSDVDKLVTALLEEKEVEE
jgi:hypothetical protein